jgi:hypothetical protein
VVCEETGIGFSINTIFPFTGQIFVHDRKRVPSCQYTFQQSWNVNVSFSYEECGIRNAGNETSTAQQFHLQIIVMFQHANGSSSVQSFIVQCSQQRIAYQKQTIPRRIEEALEELKLVPTKLEQKAPIPDTLMRIVTDVEHHGMGDGEEVNEVNVGQPLRVEFSLQPESDAYGFHVRNCFVRDMLSGAEHQVIDDRGCSTDNNIFAHPHYDTYHDVARVHWHAFKLPDHTQLSVRCQFEICTEIRDENGMNRCEAIPTPPYCPDLITSPTNSILSDVDSNVFKRSANNTHFLTAFVDGDTNSKRSPMTSFTEHVHADICFGNSTDEFCSSNKFLEERQKHLAHLEEHKLGYCTSRVWISMVTGLSAWCLVLAAGFNFYFTVRSGR